MPRLLQKGDSGPEVSELKQRLAARGFAVSGDGVFDDETYRAVRAFQAQNLDQHGQPLVVDGRVEQGGNKSSRVQGFSYVFSRMDRLLGFAQVPG